MATAAPARRKKQSRLKISAAADAPVRTEGRKAAPPAKAAAVKLAAGTERATAAKARAADTTTAVETLEIRPSGTVVSRRPAVKRPAIHHVPHQIVLALLKREIEHRTRLKDGPFSCSPYLPAWPEEGGPNPFSPVPSEKEWGDIGATGHMPLGQQGSLEEGGNLPDHVPVFPLTPHSIWSPGASDNLGGWVGSFANLSVSSAKPATNDLQEEAEDDVPALVAPPQEFEDERPVSQEFEEEEDQGPRSEVYAKGIEADHEGDSTENEEEDEEGHEGGASDLEDVQLPPDDDAARWAAEQINRWNTWSLLGYPPEQDRSSAASVESFQDLNAIGRQSSNALTEEGFKLAHNAIREDMRATLMDLVEQLSQLDVPAFMPPAPAPFEDEAEAVDSNA